MTNDDARKRQLAEGIIEYGDEAAALYAKELAELTLKPAPRYALVDVGRNPCDLAAEQVAAYLPGNYAVVGHTDEHILIAGYDHLGFTLNDYVVPRLMSGLWVATVLFGGDDA